MRKAIVHFGTHEITFMNVRNCILKADIGLLEIFTGDEHICICLDKAVYYEEKETYIDDEE